MNERPALLKLWMTLGALVIAIVLGSLLSTSIWQEQIEKNVDFTDLVFRNGMTLEEFGRENMLPDKLLIKAFRLQDRNDLQRNLNSLNIPQDEIGKSLALATEYESKNWIKIPVKFALWVLFLAGVFILMRRGKITPGLRRGLYVAAIAAFGVVLGSDPGPMGTIKDAIVLYGEKKVIFPPRMIAFVIFLLLVILVNKFICAWGCQVGTLQDLIFRLNRNRTDTKGILRQFRPTFVWTNSIRIAFFGLFVLAAFLWSTDLIEPIDPFKIYKPAAVILPGGIFLVGLLISSLFIYRPWCHLFCPFGLIGWLLEKISIFRIRVNHDTCVACQACEKACPSTVMGAILKRDRILPDCFACGNCIRVCPTGSISLATGKRGRPPAGKFTPDTSKMYFRNP